MEIVAQNKEEISKGEKMKTEETKAEPPASADGFIEEATEDKTTERTEDTERLEALTAENEALRNDIRMRTAAYVIEGELTRAGARSPKLLIETAKESLQFDEDGKLANAAAIVEHLKRQFPEQFGSYAASSIDGGAGRSSAPMLSKETLERMSPAEIQRLDWAEVSGVLSEG
jgi:predicted phage gp36 major capsid-like protein